MLRFNRLLCTRPPHRRSRTRGPRAAGERESPVKVRSPFLVVVGVSTAVSIVGVAKALPAQPGHHAPKAPLAAKIYGPYGIDRPEVDLRASRSKPRTRLHTHKAPPVQATPVKRVVTKPRPVSHPRVVHYSGSAEAWAHTPFAIAVANCESGSGRHGAWQSHYTGNPHLRGFYSGKWQMDPDFWRSYGGLAYASTPADASEAAQDAVAYRGYRARGWQPWECAGMV
jgi:hypothetical protein